MSNEVAPSDRQKGAFDMTKFMGLFLTILAAAIPSVAHAQTGETMFECRLTNGKNVRVSSQGNRLTYRYGTARRAELTLSGTATSGNVFHFAERYYSMMHQLRFQNGRYSYIVYSLPGSERADARGAFGVTVLRDGARIGGSSCRRETEFQAGFNFFESLPQDDERYNAMAID
jgi:hypothetical protein